MLAYLVYGLRWLLYGVGAVFRVRRRPADYITFRLEGAYSDYPQPTNFLMRRIRPPKPSLLELGERMRAVAEDGRVRGIVLELRPLRMMDAQLETLRDLVQEVRGRGKRVVAWSYSYTPSSYYVASAADEVLVLPGGGVEALGTASGYPFLGDALARVGLQADFIAISPYKTAADVLMRSEMSAEARDMATWLLDAAFSERLDAIAAGRGIGEEAARAAVDETPCTDERALELRLVDGIASQEDLLRRLGDGKPAVVRPWARARRSLAPRRPRRPGRHVALISIEGAIVDGESVRPPVRPPGGVPLLFEERAGDITVAEATRRVMEDRRAAAAVVYVNSPGGSATASESIRSALAALAERKPVVVAMGPVAASGGYYVSTSARPVFAQPGTVTGSIGVVIGKIVTGGLLERLGVNLEFLSRGRHTLIGSPLQPFTDEERAVVERGMRRTYDLFLQRVTEGRKVERAAVEPHAGGRVWTGRQALERGLVDEIGGLGAALRRARRLAALRDDAPLRVVEPSGAPLGPPAPRDAVAYALGSLRLLGSAMPLCRAPLVFTPPER